MRMFITFLSFFLLIGLVACQTDGSNAIGGYSNSNHSKIPQQLATDAEATSVEMEQVDDAQAVSLDKDVYVALNVTGFDRLFLKDIRKKAKKRLESHHPDAKVQLSTDKKIDLEIRELKEQLSNQDISKKQLEDKLKKIEEDMKG